MSISVLSPLSVPGCAVNPYVTNGLSHTYQMDESTFNFKRSGSDFSFLFHFSMKFVSANRIASDGTPRFAVSHLGILCLPMSHRKDTRLIWIKVAEWSPFGNFISPIKASSAGFCFWLCRFQVIAYILFYRLV